MPGVKNIGDVLDRCGVRTERGCLEFQGCRGRGGYGHLRMGSKVQLAHRVAYEMAIGPIPAGHDVCHTCDNPACCNPDHLWAGTAADNIRDMEAKGRGRHPAGSNHARAVLTEPGVQRIFQLRRGGMRTKDIARLLGIGKTTLWHVLNRDTWKHVDVEPRNV